MNPIDIKNFKQIKELKEDSTIELKTIADKLGSSFWEKEKYKIIEEYKRE